MLHIYRLCSCAGARGFEDVCRFVCVGLQLWCRFRKLPPPQLLPRLMQGLGMVPTGNLVSIRVCIVGYGVECLAVARTAYPLPPFNMTLLFGSK